ncbi:enoyl-CoA hydratase/isomerase family protein [Thermodesulfobacteriota bacterium]
MSYDNLIIEKNDHIAIITLNHPPVNAWNLGLMEDFEKAIDEIENDKDVRVLILTGAGEKCFSAGFDVSDAANSHITSPKGRDIWTRLDRFSKPVIAAINGFAMGGGLELALSCHFRIMIDDPKATIGLTELNLGIIPGWGGTQRLTRIVGKAKALDMILFSKRIGAPEALTIGLINQISTRDKLMDDAIALAEVLAKRPPLAVGAVMRAISAFDYSGLDAGLKAEEEGSAIVGKSKDCIEGFTAFLEKREPVFTGE